MPPNVIRRIARAVNRAAKACGGLPQLAAEMQVEAQTVRNWRVRGVPLARCLQVEHAARLKVRRWHLRPHDWHEHWPELVGTPGAPRISATRQRAGGTRR